MESLQELIKLTKKIEICNHLKSVYNTETKKDKQITEMVDLEFEISLDEINSKLRL